MKGQTIKNASNYIYNNRRFFFEIAKGIGKGIGAIGLLYVASKLDLPLSVSPTSGMNLKVSAPDPITVPSMIFAKDSKESAIWSLMELGRKADWDMYKMDYVKKIFRIAKECTDDNDVKSAISAINTITNSMNSSMYQKEAIDYICKLASA